LLQCRHLSARKGNLRKGMDEGKRHIKRLVVKVGTSTLTHPTGMLNIRHVEALVKVLSDIRNSGVELVLVTSGAIGVGVGKLRLESRPTDTPTKQAAASVGQCELMYIYDKLFSEYNHTVAQVLLTRDVVEDSVRKENVENSFERLLALGAIPVINENDAVAVEEIVFGDNDALSATVAKLCGADMLVIMSDIDGMYDSDPHRNSGAKLLSRVDEITDEMRAAAGGSGSNRGHGGMVTKLAAAEEATQAGIDVVIANGARPENLYDIMDGKPVGTLFKAKK